MSTSRPFVLACLLAFTFMPTPTRAAAPLAEIEARLQTVHDDLIEFRRDLHRHPELAGEEERTADRIAKRLRALGFEVTTGVGGHGIVAILKGGAPGGVVGFRADMDATAVPWPDPVEEIASTVPGVRHICGHDVHIAVGLGVAEALAAVREELPGTVKLFFQPAEENATGAKAMVADGALDAPTPSAIFTVHTYPMPAGTIGAVQGVTLAGRDWVSVTFAGEGDREAAVEAVVRELQEVTNLELPQTPEEVATMTLPEEEFALVQVLEQGAEGVFAQVTVRGDVSRAAAQAEIETRLASLELDGELDGVKLEIDYQTKAVAGVYSDPELVRWSHAPIRRALGEQGLIENAPPAPPLFSEDFGSMLQDIPGAMFWLGAANPEKGISGMPHSPGHVVDEAAINAGARAMATLLWEYLEASPTRPASDDSARPRVP